MRRRGWPAVARATPSLRPASPGRVSSRLSLPSHLDCRGAAIFSWAVKQEIVQHNPCRGVERNVVSSRERMLSDAEIPLFWKAFGNAGIPGVALQVLLLTGQRPGEVTHLRREHIAGEWWSLPGLP